MGHFGHGIETFDAYVLGDNTRMLDVFRDSGFKVQQALERSVVDVTLSLDQTGAFLARSARRARTAASASLRPFFEPVSVAVVGASRVRGKIGSEILHNLIASGFRGRVHPVHPTELSSRTFCTFRRELSSLPRTASGWRTARNVLE